MKGVINARNQKLTKLNKHKKDYLEMCRKIRKQILVYGVTIALFINARGICYLFFF